jgi:hypothetical protein
MAAGVSETAVALGEEDRQLPDGLRVGLDDPDRPDRLVLGPRMSFVRAREGG